MSTHVVDRVDSWDERSFSGGYRELHELADADFSGVVRANGAELFMTRGVVVGIRMGSIEDFEDATGSAYEAPADALPLLAVMQERSDEVRAKYYSEDTSIATVDETLADGGFTGYIELSENVLSGDYYLVYHAGKSMAVAFVGESSKLLDDDEAFETADDEVGIYQVRPVDIEPIEIPEPSTPADEADAGTGAVASASETDTEATTDESGGDGTATANEAGTSDEEPGDHGTAGAGGAAAGTTGGDPAQAASEPAAGAAAETADRGTEQRAQRGSSADETTQRGDDQPARTAESSQHPSDGQRERSQSAASRESGAGEASEGRTASTGEQQQTERTATGAEQRSSSQGSGRQSAASESARREANGGSASQTGDAQEHTAGDASTREPTTESATDGPARQPEQQAQSARGTEQQATAGGQASTAGTETPGVTPGDVEVRAIPSLNPDQTAIPDGNPEPAPPQTGGQQAGGASQATERTPEPEPEPAPRQQESQPQGAQEPVEPEPEPQQSQPQGQPAGVPDERVTELEEQLQAKDEEIDRLEAELSETSEHNEELEQRLAEVEAERDELAAEVEQLEDQLAQLEEEFGAATDADRRLTPAEALSGTDIFVRYHSKGKATLEKAHNGSPRREDVNENLRLEKHTQFDADSASVGGQAYAEFLETTLEYQFVQWVVRDLLFEIRDTGHEKALQDLYDVLPQVDRAELSGVIRVTYTEDGQQTQSEETFDVVLRDRMGNPLLVANLNDTREATTESMMEGLITSAERVGQASDTFAGAFYVTESFFEPSALEIADESTKGGILSRDKRKSFVNITRKNGYHLCLVEARNENFHLAVPEL